MNTITIKELATAPQIDSIRVARDLILWLREHGWAITPASDEELPMPIVQWPPAAPVLSTVE